MACSWYTLGLLLNIYNIFWLDHIGNNTLDPQICLLLFKSKGLNCFKFP